jgi:hypothetical protein
MKNTILYRSIILALFLCLFLSGIAQSAKDISDKEYKPYRILTSGKKITIKSTQDIENIIVWTSSGHRIMEQKEIHLSTVSFMVPANENICFIMMEIKGQKRYTEKIGVQ